MGRKIFVGNLSFDTTSKDLESLFATCGTCESASVITDRDTGRSRGFAFIEMASDSDAQAAISQLNEQPFGGRPLIVNEARPMAPRSGAGHGAGGGRSRREPRW